jgi:hypothetical protein
VYASDATIVLKLASSRRHNGTDPDRNPVFADERAAFTTDNVMGTSSRCAWESVLYNWIPRQEETLDW